MNPLLHLLHAGILAVRNVDSGQGSHVSCVLNSEPALHWISQSFTDLAPLIQCRLITKCMLTIKNMMKCLLAWMLSILKDKPSIVNGQNPACKSQSYKGDIHYFHSIGQVGNLYNSLFHQCFSSYYPLFYHLDKEDIDWCLRWIYKCQLDNQHMISLQYHNILQDHKLHTDFDQVLGQVDRLFCGIVDSRWMHSQSL